jgi:integrase
MKMNKLYNQEIKERFLLTYPNEQTRKTINNLFLKSKLIEDVLEKDLYDFSQNEVSKVIANTNPHSVQVARSTGRFISNYISWCIDPAQRLRKNSINPLKGVDPSWYVQFVDKTKKIHYSEDEFIELLESLPNAQEQAFLALIWEGIGGQKFSELREIHYNDINWNKNEITLRARNNEIVKVSNACMRYIENAYKQQTYYTYIKETGDYNERKLLSSDYIFKNVESPRTKEGELVSQGIFYSRLNRIREEFDLSYMTPNAIRQSGIIKMAVDLYERDGEFGKEQFKEIGDKYQLPMVENNGYTYYNRSLTKDYLNEQNIKELYSIDITIS